MKASRRCEDVQPKVTKKKPPAADEAAKRVLGVRYAAAEGWLSGEKPMAAVEGSTAAGEVPAAADRELVAADEGLAAENEGR